MVTHITWLVVPSSTFKALHPTSALVITAPSLTLACLPPSHTDSSDDAGLT